MEVSSFQSLHVQKLEAAIAKYKNFFENMKANDVCIYDSCDK